VLAIPPLPDHTILLVEVGSGAHGTETLPATPDRERIEAWTVATHLQVWGGSG
jgi:hypothetical protein